MPNILKDETVRQSVSVFITDGNLNLIDEAATPHGRSRLMYLLVSRDEQEKGILWQRKKAEEYGGAVKFTHALHRLAEHVAKECKDMQDKDGHVAKRARVPAGRDRDALGKYTPKGAPGKRREICPPTNCQQLATTASKHQELANKSGQHMMLAVARYKAYPYAKGKWKKPTNECLKTVVKKLKNHKYVEGVSKAFIRDTEKPGNETSHGLEPPSRMYCYLIQDGLKWIAKKSFGGTILMAGDIKKLQDPETWLQCGPQELPQFYPPTLSDEEKTNIMNARGKLLELVVLAFQGLGIIDALREFACKTYGEGCEDTVVLQELFARYYVASEQEASLGFPVNEASRTNVTSEGRSYPVHYDPRSFTVVLTLYSRHYAEDGGMELVMYDPNGERTSAWKDGVNIGPESEQIAQTLVEEGLVAKVKVHPFDFVTMANPLLHSVSELTKGDRISVVGFFGLTG
jgi:hypothetical protein